MKKCKRMLAIISTVVMMVSSFALPYGVAAEEEEAAPTSEFGQVVGVIYEGVTTTTANGGDFLGKQFNDLSPVLELTKASGNYAIVLDINIHQDYGFTDAAWMQASLGDGNIAIWATEDGSSSFNPGHLITTWLPQTGRANDTWMTVAIPLSGYSYSDIKSVQFNIYNHPEKYDTSMDSEERKYGASISYRNIYLVDMSRNADGGLREEVATFGSPAAAEITHVNADGVLNDNGTYTNHTVTSIPTTKIFYNGITSDIELSKLNLEFDMMYTSDNADFDPSKIVNGSVRLYDPSERNATSSYTSGKVALTDTWYHFSIPFSAFSGLTDATALTQVYAFNYNDVSVNGVQTNPGFVSHVKNIRVTHSDITALQAELENAKNYVYDVDENVVAYETALNNARNLFDNTEASYEDFAAALTALNEAKASLTNFRNVTYEVVRFSDQEYTKKVADVGRNQYWYNWSTGDGLSNAVADLTDATGENVIGDYRYVKMTVTLERNTAYTGEITVPDLSSLMKNVQIRFRAPDNSRPDGVTGECRSDSFTLSILDTVEENDKITYTMEGVLNDAAESTGDRKGMNWSKVRQSIIFVNLNQDLRTSADAGSTDVPVYCTLSDVLVVNKTAEKVDEELTTFANAVLPTGKYTASSAAAYLASQDDAKAMLNNADATLQQKSQLLKKIDEAKAQLEGIIPEYVQFGTPETIDAFTNTGVEGQHSINRTFNVTKNQITGEETFSSLQLRMEIMVTRDDGQLNVTNALVNGNLKIQGAQNDGAAVDMQKNFAKDANSLLGNATAGKWNTIYLNLSDFSNCTEATDLSTITKVVLFAYNDLRGATSNPGIEVQVRNVAIVDGTNSDLVNRLAEAFADVTEGGTKDFTPDSLAAYQAVYDEWYSVYEYVDINRAEEAIAAMAEAKTHLVCVDPEVLTFSAINKEYTKQSDTSGQFYADWKGSDQGLVDITDRNVDNLRIRFDVTFNAAEGVENPLTTLTFADQRLAVRHQGGDERGFNRQARQEFVATATVGETIHVDYKLSDMTDNRNGDNLLRDLIFWIVTDDLAGVPQNDYTMTIANARVVDVTKENMAAALETAASMTLDEMGAADGVVYDETGADDLKAAQAAALELLKVENPTYAQLDEAQKAIDTAKAGLKAIGHTVLSFGQIETGTTNNWIGKNGTKVTPTDLSKYDYSKLSLRFIVRLMAEDGSIVPPEDTAVYVKNGYFILKAYDENNVETNLAAKEKGFQIGDTVFDIPLSTMSAQNKDNLDMTCVSQLDMYGYVKEKVSDANETQAVSQKYKFVADNVRIVDTTAEDNLGTVSVEGNGYVEITGGLVNGTTDTLTAKTTATDGTTFDHWVVNGETKTENPIILDVTGSQNVTAVFENVSESVTVEFIGKYNETFAVKDVASAAELSALLNGGVTAPVIHGYKFVSWSENDAEVLFNENIGGSVKIQAVYETDTDTTYTLTFDGATMSAVAGEEQIGNDTALTFDQRVTVTAADADKTVAYWVLDGAKVGFNANTYTFYISGGNEISAVYADDADYEAPTNDVVLQQAFLTTNNSTYTFTVIAQTSIPDAQAAVTYGILYSNRYSELCALTDGAAIPEDAGLYVNVVSTKTAANQQFMTSLLNVETGKYRYARAYVVLADGTTVYSDTFAAVHTGTGNPPSKLAVSDYAQ